MSSVKFEERKLRFYCTAAAAAVNTFLTYQEKQNAFFFSTFLDENAAATLDRIRLGNKK